MVRRVIKGIFLLLLAGGLVAGITIGVPMFNETFTSIVVATVNLSPGMRIGEGMAVLRVWPVATVPEGAIHSLASALGTYASKRVVGGGAILTSHVTHMAPPPVRLSTRAGEIYTGYSIIAFRIPRRDAANLFVGDRVDVTLPYCASTKRDIVVEEVTIRKGWRVHHIDHEDREAAAMLNAVVYLEIKNDEARATLTRPRLMPPHGTTRMVRSER